MIHLYKTEKDTSNMKENNKIVIESASNRVKVGKRIKIAREKINMTQEELAKTIGCTSQHISVIERGIKSPKLDTLIKIINTLCIPPDILLQDVIEFQIDNTYDKEFSSIVGWLSNEDKQIILKVVRSLSGSLYEKELKRTLGGGLEKGE